MNKTANELYRTAVELGRIKDIADHALAQLKGIHEDASLEELREAVKAVRETLECVRSGEPVRD